jgi:hypothetical protein|tara:strand:+ start:355 stop:960 length:606 start_codon:yes stop_codon:yes gene_type:complete
VNKVFFLLLIPIIGLTQSRFDSNPIHWKKEHVSVGFFNHNTGYSLVSYSRNIFRNKNYEKHTEYYVAFGTNIFQHTISLGLKKYLLESSLNKTLYTSIATKGVYSLGKWEDYIAPCISIGMDIPMVNHSNYYGSKLIGSHPFMWILKPFHLIKNYINKLGVNFASVPQKEFINLGISTTIRYKDSSIRFITIPYINLSYRW